MKITSNCLHQLNPESSSSFSGLPTEQCPSLKVRKTFEMVDSQDMSQVYGGEDHHHLEEEHQQQSEECEAALLSSIETADLMDLDSDLFMGLGHYQEETVKLEAFPSAMDQQQQQQLHQPETPSTPASVQSLLALEHLNRAPTLDEMQDPAVEFNVDLNGESSGKSSWMFSSRLNKVFVKMGQPCTFNVSYQVGAGLPQMQVRAMLVCSSLEDMYQPIYRCENHRGNDRSNPNLSPEVIAHVMRCFNPSVRYVGTEQGVAFKDRLAVVVPLDTNVVDQVVTSNVSLEFVCQNSCRIINRRPTAIIFTLEDGHGQILGKKSLHLKVCSCPKRDKQKEEEPLGPASKRKSDAGSVVAPPGKKVPKLSSSHRSPSGATERHSSTLPSAGKLAFIKKEPNLRSPGSPAPFTRSASGGGGGARSLTPLNSSELVEQTATTIAVPMPSVSAAVKVAEYAFQVVAGDLVRCVDDDQRKHLAAFLTQIRRLQSKYEQYV